MFENKFQKKPIVVKPTGEGCKIKVSRDTHGRVTSIETNGKCQKDEIQLFKENLGSDISDDED